MSSAAVAPTFDLDIVSYSAIDRKFYVRWPASGRYHEMAAIPASLIDRQHDADLVRVMTGHGFRVGADDGVQLCDWLQSRAVAHLPPAV